MSLMYRMNSSGRSIYPWGNPTSYTVIEDDHLSLNLTDCFLLYKYDFIKLWVCPLIIRVLCHICEVMVNCIESLFNIKKYYSHFFMQLFVILFVNEYITYNVFDFFLK